MQKDMLQSIDDSALEAVSGGHDGLLSHIREVRSEIRAHVREHVADALDHVGDTAGAVLSHVGGALQKLGGKLAD
jgi:hypothetical protein